MKLKTFLSTYLLFLCVLFSSLCIVSVYLTNSQIDMLREKCSAEYRTIAASLAKDIAVLSGRTRNLSGDVDALVKGYSKYYKKNGIALEMTVLTPDSALDGGAEAALSFIDMRGDRYVYVSGALSEPFQSYRVDYYYNITQNMADLRNTQNLMLAICAAFSVMTAFVLYFILSAIFKPVGMIAGISRKIAGGQYSERIRVNGKNELSSMADDFNRMAEQIERQIALLEEEAAQKQRFVDNFAHEIRTPLTSVYGYAEYMQKASLDEKEIIDSAQSIMDEASRVNRIADSLLELATLRQYAPIRSEINISRLFEDICQTLKTRLDERDVRLECNNGVKYLEGQEDLIKSLLLNLCQNAIKACSPKTGVIRLDAAVNGENIILSVSDNGCGIPEESLPSVTEPFYRVDKARSREQGGAGLGLAICRQIAEAHNAEIYIESSLGAGTTVRIIFTTLK